MDQPTLNFFLYLAGSIIVILLGVIAYFLKQSITAVSTLQNTVSDLRSIYQGIKTDIVNLKQAWAEESRVTEKRLDNHAARLDVYADRITTIEAKISP